MKSVNKVFPTICAAILVFFLGVVAVVPTKALAAEPVQDQIQQAFSLETAAPQEVRVTLPDGTTGRLGVRPVVLPTRGSINMGNGTGTWEVYWYTAVLNTSYRVVTSNYRITRCTDNYSGGIGIVIDSCTLSWGPTWSQQTTRHHDAMQIAYDTRFLNGNIQGHNLVTSVYYG